MTEMKTAYEVHAVSGTGHQTYIANGVQRTQFVESKALVHEMNRHELHRAETSIDTPNKLVHSRSQILILFDVLP